MVKRLGSVWLGLVVVALTAMAGNGVAKGQALPTATQTMDLSFFGAGTGTYTELDFGRNAGITAGADLTFRSLYYHLRPAIELRGNYAIDEGQVDGQKSVLIGPRISRNLGRFSPYVDGFFGRGELTYPGGIIIGNYRYDRTTTNVYAGGGGLDYRVTRHFDAKADILFERWATPVIDTGYIYPIPISFGVVYHLDFNDFGHKQKRRKKDRAVAAPPAVDTAPPPPPPANP